MIGFKTKKKPATMHPDKIDPSRALYVFIDPADGGQSVAPEPDDFFIIDVNGTERAFLFDKYSGDNCQNCAKCSLGPEDSAYSNAVCRKMLCLTQGVYGVEYAYNNDDEVFEPLAQPDETTQDTNSEPPIVNEPDKSFGNSEQLEPADDETNDDEFDAEPPTVDPEPKTPDERRAAWERALRDLEAEAQRSAEQAAEYKTLAKQAAKNAAELRAKILDILWRGSENYESSTPLFDAAFGAALDENTEGAF